MSDLTHYRIAMFLVWFTILCFASAFCLAIVGVILQSDILGGLCGVTAFSGFITAFGLGITYGDGLPYKPENEYSKMNRQDKKKLKSEQSRIAFDQRIRQMEREAGL